ncbi:histidine--tRNA ligase [Acidobacteriota bacterium]
MMAGKDKKKKKVKARLLKGFRDILPEQMIARNRVVETFRQVFERYGFAPLETPAMEHVDVLLDEYGEEGTKELFRFDDPDGADVALRYDLTVSLARVVAQYQDLPIPFRRYQIANCWRWDKPGPGRFREFLQFDVDTVGTTSPAADAEILSCMSECLDALGIKDFLIRYNSRKLLNLIVLYSGVAQDRAKDVFRVLDKLDKYGREEVLKELTGGRVDVSGDKIPGLGLADDHVKKIDQFISLPKAEKIGAVTDVEKLLSGQAGLEGCLEELSALNSHLEALGVDLARTRFDPTLARGLDYYTGIIYEAVLPAAPQFGTIFGGGQYDGLVERFLGRKIPGTGASIGVDRLLDIMVSQGTVTLRKSTAEVLVCVLDKEKLQDYQEMTQELRRSGINTELFLGTTKNLGKQLKHADRTGVALAVLAGEDEFKQNTVSVKNLHEGIRHTDEASDRASWLDGRYGQITVARSELVSTIKSALKALEGGSD